MRGSGFSTTASSRAQGSPLIQEMESRLNDFDCAAGAREVLSKVLDGEAPIPTMAAGAARLRGVTRRFSKGG